VKRWTASLWKSCLPDIGAKTRARADRVRVHFLGVRGSTPAPGLDFVRYGGHTSCLALAHDGADAPTLLLDAGTGIRRASALCPSGVFAGVVLLSHLHWDHLHGLPFFSAADREDARTEVVVPVQLSGESPVEVIARGMSPPHFPVRPDELRGEWTFRSINEGELDVEGFEVKALEIPHKGGRTFGFRISDGHSSLAYMPDHYPSVLGPGPDGWGEYHPAAMELASEVDVLVHDSQLVAEEIDSEAWFGHAAAEYAVGLATAARAQHTALFHYKPDRSDDAIDEIAQRFAGRPVTASTQSLVLEL
jgi:phosphoribosyl 1,2-cyclic phosphodiesterase